MDEDEIERLIAELRVMLREAGFGWAAEQAEAALPTGASKHMLAHALTDATEAVTVDLAQAERDAVRVLGVEEIVFEPDPGADGGGDDDGRVFNGLKAGAEFDGGDRLRGQQRRAALDAMPAYATAFAELRGRLDGIL